MSMEVSSQPSVSAFISENTKEEKRTFIKDAAYER